MKFIIYAQAFIQAFIQRNSSQFSSIDMWWCFWLAATLLRKPTIILANRIFPLEPPNQLYRATWGTDTFGISVQIAGKPNYREVSKKNDFVENDMFFQVCIFFLPGGLFFTNIF